MHNYEIRLLNPDGKPVTHAGRYLGDYHAIRRARTLARGMDGLEVWRGPHCIYRDGAAATLEDVRENFAAAS